MRASDLADPSDTPVRWWCRARASRSRIRCTREVVPDGSFASHYCTDHQAEARQAERDVSAYRRRLDPGPLPVEG